MNTTAVQKPPGFKRLGHTGPMIWTIVLGAIVILAAGFTLAQEIVSDEREQVFANFQDINSKLALSDEVRIRSLLASLDRVLLVVRKDYAERPGLTRDELLRRLEELKVDNELSPRMSMVDASGDIVLSSARNANDSKPKVNVADRAFFLGHKTDQDDHLHVGIPIQSRVTGKWVVPLTRRISRKDGSFGGVLNLTVDPGLFTEPFAKTSMGSDATRAIMGLDGYTHLRVNGGALTYGGDSRKSQLFTEIKKAAVGCYTATASSDGVRRSVCYRVIDPYAIVILAGSSVASIEGVYSAKVRGYLGGALLMGVLIVLLSGVLILGALRQRKLQESQQSFEQLIEMVPQSIARIDARGEIVWVNRRTMDYAGPSADEQARGFDWVLAAVHPDDLARVKDFVATALAMDQCTDFCEYRKRRFDGAYIWYSSQITRVTDADGGVSFLQTGTDIHDRKMAEKRARVTQKLESIGQLTGGMAHDFNNLLAIIVGNLDLVKPDVKVDAAAKRLDVAISAALRGVGLVKSLLAMASKQPLLPATIDLWALVERISPLLLHALGPRVQFKMTPPAFPVHVEVDEAGLEAVLLNLIVNARDAMPRGGELTLRLDARDGMACIAIKDNGTGMPEAVLKRATEPFFTTKERDRGTGLGLSMVAGFVKQSRGTMKIQSAEGQGTTIEITLPLALTEPAAVAPIHPSPPVAVPSPEAATTSKRRILIVDDEPALAELVRDWARAEGHIAVLAHSADDGLTLLAVRAFDVLISDIIMPGQLDGIGFSEKASALHPAMKILLMSGYSRETATNRADVPWPLLVKPFRREDFVAALEKACSVSGFAALV